MDVITLRIGKQVTEVAQGAFKPGLVWASLLAPGLKRHMTQILMKEGLSTFKAEKSGRDGGCRYGRR